MTIRLPTPEMSNDSYQEFRRLGFHCLQSTKVHFLDGTEATATAHSFCDGKECSGDTSPDWRTRRFYSIRRGYATEIVNELTLENRMGKEQFQRLS